MAESLTPTALIGAGGFGKTSIALTVLHHDRVKQWFGENRRFIRCDRLRAMLAHLNRLSKVTGMGIENPEDSTPLRPLMSSREIVIVLDNTESILNPEGTDTGDLCIGGGAERTADPVSVHNVVHLHHSSWMQYYWDPDGVNGCRLSRLLSHL